MHCYGKNNNNRSISFSLGLDTNARTVRVYSMTEMEPVFEIIEGWMRLLGYPRRDLFAVWLSVHEAVVNAFRHGNNNEPGKSVQIRYLVTPAEVLVEIQDEGSGFDVDLVPDPLSEEYRDRPGGRGIFLMRVYASWVSFNPKGNGVLLCRQRSNP
jgi:serine/threonine-protein kinase RsbW